jgi:hypothetical protein
VTLEYGTTSVDALAWGLTLLGLLGLVVLWRWGRVAAPSSVDDGTGSPARAAEDDRLDYTPRGSLAGSQPR